MLGKLISTYAALILSAVAQADLITNLQTALESNRDIGVAIGILMAWLAMRSRSKAIEFPT